MVSVPMASIIFITLKGGQYNDHWTSELKPLLAGDAVAGYRELHWCGQPKQKRDRLVRPGTLVAVRPNAKTMAFTLVGKVVEKQPLTEGRVATYTLLVEMSATPREIVRDKARDRCVHWTVLREVGIPHSGAYMPEGIYGQ